MGVEAFSQTTLTSTQQDQKELAVTVYNSNIGLVRDVRRLRLPAGKLDIRYMDIAARVNPATVHIVSLTAPKDLTVLEQNYEYDLLSPQKLLSKYVGKEVTLIRLRTENNSTREEAVKATLLALNEGPVWQVGNEIITGMGADRLVFPDLPENLYSKPTLVWLLDNRRAGEHASRRRRPIAPFFRFPDLQQPPQLLAYLGSRNISTFSTDINSFEFKLHRPELVIKSVMTKLEKRGKGIVLMHDFQHATAEAMPELLRQLKAAGFKIVHMVPKAPVTTLAKYDDMLKQQDKMDATNTRPQNSVVKTISGD